MAFPMYATVVWLTWVLLVQVGVDGLVWFGAALVLLGFGAWLLGRSQRATGRWAALTAILVAIGIANPPAPTVSGQGPVQTSSASGWEAYSKTRIGEHNAAGKAVFVDFTAAWCVTCQVNKKVVLETQAVRDGFGAKNVALMRADWTRRDPAITAALAAFGRSGVPVYALYAPGKAPVLLPEILSERIVLDALKTL
jgi:thiol:disulfide interchange protein DsbD